MPRTRIHESARPLTSRTGYRLFLIYDLLLMFQLALWAIFKAVDGAVEPTWFPWATLGYALLTSLSTLYSFGLWAGAMVWRRRLALVFVMATLWRGSPLESRWMQVAAVIWAASVWIALLSEGRRISLAVAEATGEEVLGADPERPDR